MMFMVWKNLPSSRGRNVAVMYTPRIAPTSHMGLARLANTVWHSSKTIRWVAVDVKSLGQRRLAPPAIWNTGRRSHHIVASNRYANGTMTMVVPPGLQNTGNMKIMLLPALDDDKYGAASVYDGLDGPLPLRLRTTPMDVGMPHLTMPLDLHRPAGLVI
jgi:hypothetical protein